MGTTDNKYNYPFRYCNSHKLCDVHGVQYTTLERWQREEKEKGKIIPGRINIPGVRSYIWDPNKFHDLFLLPKLYGPVRNEYEKQEHIVILNNNKRRKAV